MSIKQLPGEVISQIKSSIVITSLNGVVTGILRNALDAEATKVNISVDYRRGSCSVEDDGQGIPPPEFDKAGGLGHLYSTSKYPHCREVYGRNGEFLASVAALSLLTVSSHHHMHRSHNSLSVHNSKVIGRNTPALPEQRIVAFPHGTRVTVRDLFGSMPVRVKQRAADTEKSTANKDWDRLCRGVVAVLLAWPKDTTITVRDQSNGETVTLRTTESLGRARGSRPTTVLRTARLLCQASLCEISDIETWVPITAHAHGVSVSGCVSLTPAATKQIQFISLGIQPVRDESHSNILYEEINRLFSNSGFGSIESDDGATTSTRPSSGDGITRKVLKSRKGLDRWPMFALSISLDTATETGLTEVNDMLDDRRSHLSAIVDLLKAMFYEFLKKHHFRPQSVQLSLASQVRFDSRGDMPNSHLPQESTHQTDLALWDSRASFKRRRLGDARSGSGQSSARSTGRRTPDTSQNQVLLPFAHWTQVKAGRQRNPRPKLAESSANSRLPDVNGDDVDNASNPEEAPSATELRLVGALGTLLRKPFDDIVETPVTTEMTRQPPPVAPEGISSSEYRDTMAWNDRISKSRLVIDTRTGFVVRPCPSRTGSNLTTGSPGSHSRVGNTSRAETGNGAPSPWLRDLLSSWKNPVFEAVESPIPRLTGQTEKLGDWSHHTGGCCDTPDLVNLGSNADQSSVNLQGRISKSNLLNAELIAQVDQKFLLVMIHASQSTTDIDDNSSTPSCPSLLVLVDQHAADERCRVESLMRDYFESTAHQDTQRWKARTVALDRPLHLDLPAQEHRLLSRHKRHFEHWGVFCETVPSHAGGAAMRGKGAVKMRILSLPPSIVERCRLEPRLAVEFIRKELWNLAETNGSTASMTPSEAITEKEHAWVGRFHDCPHGILDMINSRACRSAIMFNDVLSVEECTSLIRRLAECAFPFQCAHGRPSMIPLLDIGSSRPVGAMGGFLDAETKDAGFVQHFARWKGR